MANYRPKSLNELNQVYDKALQAQRAIREGSRNLSDEAPSPAAASHNIFDELKQQAETAKKPEIYDSEIADIANDFLKRYTQPEPTKAPPAPKELKRPAPSIQSLYHTPVTETEENTGKDVSISQSAEAPAPTAAPAAVTRPRPFESLEATAVPKAEEEPAGSMSNEDTGLIPEVPFTPVQTPVGQKVVFSTDHTPPSPPQRITSAERNDLINEYKRVMSDDDDYYFDDDDDYGKPKKTSFWSKLKKRRQDTFEEVAEDTPEEIAPEYNEEDEALPMTDIYSSMSYPAEAPADDADKGEEVPMSLYDYLEADFDYGDEEETAVEVAPEAEEIEEVDESLSETEEIEEAAESLPEAKETEEVIEYTPEAEEVEEVSECVPEAEETEEAAEYTPETVETEEIVSDEPTVEELITEDIPDVFTEETEEAEIIPEEEEPKVLIPEEEAETTTEEAVVYPTEEENPTAGMTFDDIFSVSDESKRSYTGGDWSHTAEDSTEEEYSAESFDDNTEEDNAQSFEMPKKRAKTKRNPAVTVLLSLVLVVLVATAGFVTALGSIVGVDTGKLFGDSYRAFSAQQNFSLSGVYAGDLIITHDYSTYDADGDSFVYVNYNTKEFMVGKYKGHTYGLTGDELYVAQNEAGSVLVLREDTLGAIVKTYSGIGTVLSVLSNNFIVIDAVVLVLFIAVLLLLILPGKIRKNKAEPTAEAPVSYGYSQEYTENAETEEEPVPTDEEDDVSYDPDEYDTDELVEGLFSSI